MEQSDVEAKTIASSDDAVSDKPITYYSPNVPLDNERWREMDESFRQGNPSEGATDVVNEYSFFDEAVIHVRAGSGGQGSATYKKAVSGQNGPADGGNGGRGGNIVLVTDPSLNTLAGLTNAWRPNSFGGSAAAAMVTARPKSFKAENGGDGGRGFNNGRSGGDVFIRVPPGTVVQEQILDGETGKVITTIDIGTLTAVADDDDAVKTTTSLVVARGGEGGEGSGLKNRGVRRPRVPPRGGERKVLKLTLKIVADVALVGVPNAGKSTFLAAVTRYDCMG